MGATIMPAAPGFYHNPQTIDDLVDFVVARILDHLSIEQSLVARWGYQTAKHSEE
jgi:4-hydroxy-3-polyprenylbenzoate decarboxylase